MGSRKWRHALHVSWTYRDPWNVTPDVRTVAWSPDGQYIASGGSDDTVVQVWRAG
ncbi:MAG: hypothetical protein ACYDER_10800 [Ktedonobacteraceae bacterium]